MSAPKETTARAVNARTLEEARERHGKPFRAHTRIERVTPPSPLLRRLNRLSEHAKPSPALRQVVGIDSARAPARRKA